MWKWLRIALLGVRGADWVDLNSRLEQLERSHASLHGTFTRFSAVERMRTARDIKAGLAAAEASALIASARTKAPDPFENLE